MSSKLAQIGSEDKGRRKNEGRSMADNVFKKTIVLEEEAINRTGRALRGEEVCSSQDSGRKATKDTGTHTHREREEERETIIGALGQSRAKERHAAEQLRVQSVQMIRRLPAGNLDHDHADSKRPFARPDTQTVFVNYQEAILGGTAYDALDLRTLLQTPRRLRSTGSLLGQ